MDASASKGHGHKWWLWAVKILLAAGLCWLVVGKTHLKDKLEIREGNDQTKVLWGQLLGRTEKGEWRWRDANGIEKTIADKEVIRTINGAGSPEPNFERGLANLAATVYRSGWAWLAVGLIPLAIVLGAWRWQKLLRAGGIDLPYRKALRLTLMGNFFNHALPSLVGGDVLKAYYVMRFRPNHKSQTVISLLADRLTGLSALAIICLAAIGLNWNDPLVAKIKGPILLVVALLGLVAAVLFVPGVRRGLRLSWLIERLPFKKLLGKLREAVRLYSAQPRVLVQALAMSVVIHLILLNCMYLGGLALTPGLSYHSYLLLLPPTWMISAIPITPGAVGLMEAMYQKMFEQVGVSATSALGLSLFNRFMLLIWSLPGLIIYIRGPGLPATQQYSMEQVEEIIEGEIDEANSSGD